MRALPGRCSRASTKCAVPNEGREVEEDAVKKSIKFAVRRGVSWSRWKYEVPEARQKRTAAR